jgi:hypothetical protein
MHMREENNIELSHDTGIHGMYDATSESCCYNSETFPYGQILEDSSQ